MPQGQAPLVEGAAGHQVGGGDGLPGPGAEPLGDERVQDVAVDVQAEAGAVPDDRTVVLALHAAQRHLDAVNARRQRPKAVALAILKPAKRP